MGGYGDIKMIDENGLRMDGRSATDVRPITIETGVVPVADGSCRMTWGTNDVIVAVYGPMEAHPRKIQRQDRACLLYTSPSPRDVEESRMPSSA